MEDDASQSAPEPKKQRKSVAVSRGFTYGVSTLSILGALNMIKPFKEFFTTREETEAVIQNVDRLEALVKENKREIMQVLVQGRAEMRADILAGQQSIEKKIDHIIDEQSKSQDRQQSARDKLESRIHHLEIVAFRKHGRNTSEDEKETKHD